MNGDVKMRLSQEITPSDGVVDGFMVPSMEGPKEDPRLKVEIFVDDDFRAAVDGNITIVWGLQRNSSRQAQFTEVAEGVYRDVLYENNTRRFLPEVSPSNAAIYVGGFSTPQEVFGEETTAMFLR